MVKAPVAGQVKTRLARETGTVRATQFYRHTAAALIARLAPSRHWRTILAVAPDNASVPACWRRGVARWEQGRGGLGQRMQRILDRAPPGPVIIVGTDIPAIRPAAIAAAFAALGRADAVVGPAADGGYWLVGLRRTPRVLRPFADVRWSTRHALTDTLANLAGRPVARAATLSDVDGLQDLLRQRGHHGRLVRPATLREDCFPT